MGLLASCFTNHIVYGENQSPMGQSHLLKMQAFKASLVRHDSAPSPSPSNTSPSPQPQEGDGSTSTRVYHVTSYGADPTGKTDSTDAIIAAMSAAFEGPKQGFLMEGIANLGGARIDLQGGHYLVSRPLRFPATGAGNVVIHGGTLRASDDFPTGGYLIDLSSSSSTNKSPQNNKTTVDAQLSSSSYNYEYITLKDLMLDSNYRGGAISVINSLRTSIDNCYITHFTTTGIQVQQGHETYIRNSFLGQHITAGGDPGERNFSGTAIVLAGNDNAVTDVVIFSAAVGIMVSGQANTLSGVHCYNKATGFGGTGIYLKLPGLTQTRIVNCYLDYTGIVAEDPVQLLISNSFFLGDAYVVLKSVNGVANGVNIVDNMFSGSGKGVEIVQLDQSKGPFKDIDQVVVDRNNVKGMKLRATVAKGAAQGNGTSWTVDFNGVLLFPNLIRDVQYSLSTNGGGFPNHVLRNSSANRVVIESNVAVPGSVSITVNQGVAIHEAS
ncbi:hypothetical protein L484_004905 [Morus notabilis]|uniref:Rhamnogalacturonase A/B/Epimerase-like pectate lyase domain-containing protein n=2 Tax=Morus notabilis TaxID=981085 RepID=W9R3J3_9ROSA|nr:hypothetical protein L484_004905 [Morus notabilis]